jgi:hypothetical protein
LAWCRVELQEVELHELVHLHNSSFITASVAIIGSREDSNHVAFMGPIVSVHHELMGASDADEVIGVVELLGNILTERVARSTGGDTPTTPIIGIRPQ